MNIRENVALAQLTTLVVGGPARYFVEANSIEDVSQAIDFARAKSVPLFVMAGGSNLLVADAGFDGLIVKVGLRGMESKEKESQVTFCVAAGEEWDAFVAQTVEEQCAGIECLSGIPGSVGATPVQNVGAYGQEVSETIREVTTLDTNTLQCKTFSNTECEFSYRSSIFNTTARDRYVILSVTFALQRGGAPTLRYADVQRAFANARSKPSLSDVRNAVRDIRRNKAMLLVSGDEDCRSVGSFFKNPLIASRQYEELRARLNTRGLDAPSYPAGDGMRKLSAAWLVEHAGLRKGYTRGAAAISRKHALAIINRGGATAAEIIALKNEIQERVRAEFGIELQPEPVLLGF